MDETWADALVGETLSGRYLVEELIGAGGMGVVLRATHLKLNRPVAIKLLHPSLARDEVATARFHQEAQAAASVGTHGVVDIIDLDEDERFGSFLVMELLRGRSLVDVLKEGRMATVDALELCADLLHVLAAVHDKGIVHRDLKPPNVFFHEDEVEGRIVKVLDFGIAKVNQRLTMTGQLLGTPRFMSPEQARGETLDHRCDLYATGLLLYCALTGLPPYATVPEAHIIERVSEGPPSLRTMQPDLPEVLLAFVDRALAPMPDDRFEDATAMSAALKRVREEIDGPLESTPPAPDLGDGVSTLRTDPPVFSETGEDEDDASAPSSNDERDEPIDEHSGEEHSGDERSGEAPSAELALPQRSWSVAIAVLLLASVATGVWIYFQLASRPEAVVALEREEGECELPGAEVTLRHGNGLIRVGDDGAPLLEFEELDAARYRVTLSEGTRAWSAELNAGSAAGRIDVHDFDPPAGVIDVSMTRVTLLGPAGRCVLRGDVHNR